MPQRIPVQLKKLNYHHHQISCRKTENIGVEYRWDKVRNSIAHHNHKATFEETFGSLIVLASFMEEFPAALIAYRNGLRLGTNNSVLN